MMKIVLRRSFVGCMQFGSEFWIFQTQLPSNHLTLFAAWATWSLNMLWSVFNSNFLWYSFCSMWFGSETKARRYISNTQFHINETSHGSESWICSTINCCLISPIMMFGITLNTYGWADIMLCRSRVLKHGKHLSAWEFIKLQTPSFPCGVLKASTLPFAFALPFYSYFSKSMLLSRGGRETNFLAKLPIPWIRQYFPSAQWLIKVSKNSAQIPKFSTFNFSSKRTFPHSKICAR